MTLPGQYTHEIPFPIVVRAMLFVAGAAACGLTVFELGRGVWPLNVFSPFFGFMIIGGCFVGFSFMAGAIRGPSVVMAFAPGQLTVTKRWPWGVAVERHEAGEIRDMEVVIDTSSDGPDEWYVAITLDWGARLTSRRFGSEVAARAEMAAFQAALAEPPPPPNVTAQA